METSTSAAMNSRGVRQRRWPGVPPTRREREDGNRGNFPREGPGAAGSRRAERKNI